MSNFRDMGLNPNEAKESNNLFTACHLLCNTLKYINLSDDQFYVNKSTSSTSHLTLHTLDICFNVVMNLRHICPVNILF